VIVGLFPFRSLVVSCQARADSPLHGPGTMALMAAAAAAGGAAGIRANGAPDIAAIRASVQLPIIGISKTGDPGGVLITPTVRSAVEVVAAGADVVAIDGTSRPRPGGETLADVVAGVRRLGVPVMADVDSVENGLASAEAGADLIATTLSGYTGGPVPAQPDLDLVRRLAALTDRPIVAEGRYWTPEDVLAAYEAGASLVVVGTAVTNPTAITSRLAGAR
jgi:N-acylglucosamine-6-phosphate 2-epimerase